MRTSVVLISSLSLLILISAQGSNVNDNTLPCPDGKVHKDCGGSCGPTCDNPNPICDHEKCGPGCVCPSGTVESSNGKCIKIDECCKGNMTYGCANDCPNNCANLDNPDILCTMDCKIGCGCKTGYWRIPNSDRCVLPQDCPKAG